MKTKKVLALVVLAAFLISIVPFAAFGAINTYSTAVKAPDSSVEAQPVSNGPDAAKEDGAEFTVVITNPAGLKSGDDLYIATSRDSVDYISYEDSVVTTWKDITGNESITPVAGGSSTEKVSKDELPAAAYGLYSYSVDFKVVSSVDKTSNVVFGSDPNAVNTYAKGRDFEAGKDLTMIVQQKKFPVEFTAAKADEIQVKLDGFDFKVDADGKYSATSGQTPKPANGVDTYKVQAFVYANKVPVAGKDVNFTILKGNGLTLTATKATTDVTGKAEVKVYSTKATGTEPAEIQARTSGIKTEDSPKVYVVFETPGITSLKAEDSNNQKVARDAGTFEFKFSAYDASGNRVTISEDALKEMTRTIVTKPSGTGISDSGDKGDNLLASKGFYLKTRDDGDAEIVIDTDKLKKDGDYEVKVYLNNGSAVSYKFNAKTQGDVVKMELDYGATSYAGESKLPQPKIKYYDAEGYKISVKYGEGKASVGNVKLSISDASFLDGEIDGKGQFTLKEDKAGVITMTAIDTVEKLVATQTINVQKPASYLKLTPQSVGAVGSEVTVDIELVDVDGKLAATGREIDTSSATIIAKPEGAIASADSISTSDFTKGKAKVKVSSNMEGDVTLQVIITEKKDNVDPKIGGRTFTGACTVSFGKASTGSGQVIFIVGAPSYVSGNQVFAAESPSFIDNGRTFLGVRDMGTSIGATIEWDQASQTATLSKDGVTIKVTVGANKIAVTKNGVTSEIEIDAPAQNKNGRVYLPFRAVMEAFNYTVTFDQATNSIVCAL